MKILFFTILLISLSTKTYSATVKYFQPPLEKDIPNNDFGKIEVARKLTSIAEDLKNVLSPEYIWPIIFIKL